MKLLYVKGSPRGEKSTSARVAEAFITAYRTRNPQAEIDEIDLWQENFPEFNGDSAAAKMSFFGEGTLDGARKTAWDQIVAITQRFASADDYLFTVPMWNGGIPYRLKLYIDIMTQPGLMFGFDPVKGYSGVLQGKRATTVYTSGVYSPGVPPAFGTDFHSTYFNDWLRFIGITDTATVRYQPTLLTSDPAAGLAKARDEAVRAGQR
ncbi:MAG: NAD(P)H-dependent oxidoreductase [Betaproteobacteria bacterium]|nr:NAD(P)H-dependent oxidoreductase [Betaproteobacteria bacterium]